MPVQLMEVFGGPVGASLVGGLIAFFAALALTPLVIRVARRRGWIDEPSEDRWHDRPVALMGGIAIGGAVAVGLASGGDPLLEQWPVWGGAALLFGVGLADDRWDVRPEVKMLAQVAAASAVLYAGYAFWAAGPGWVSFPLTFLWVIGVTNAVNLVDGIDGLAAGVAGVSALALTLVSLVQGPPEWAIAMAVLAGAAFGFLVYNAPPARVFMGDCGSLLLGYLLAVGALGVQAGGDPLIGTLVPIAVLAVPIFDTTFVTVTRLLQGKPVSEGGTDHVHHRLIRLGFSEARATVVLCVASVTFGGLAIAALWMRPNLTLAVAAFCLAAAGVVGGYLALTNEGGGDVPGLSEQIGALMRRYAGGPSWKSVLGVVGDFLVVGAALVVALHLRFDGAPPAEQQVMMGRALPAVIVLKLAVFYAFGLYEGIWRHAGTPEVMRLVGASTLASVLVAAGFAVVGPGRLLGAVLVLDWMVTTVGVGGLRFGFRALRQYFAAHREEGRRTFVYGTDRPSLLAVRHLRHRPDRTPVGLLSDDPAQHGLRVQGIEVVGEVDDLAGLRDQYEVDEVIVPVRAVSPNLRRRIQARCAEQGVDCWYFGALLRPAEKWEATVHASAAGDGARPVPRPSAAD